MILTLEIKYSMFYATVLDSRFFITRLLTCSLYVKALLFFLAFCSSYVYILYHLRRKMRGNCFIPFSVFNV